MFERVRGLPSPARQAVTGALVLGVPGAVIGLVLGLVAYPPTAWAAVLEVALPAAALGMLGGLVTGLLTTRRRRSAGSRRSAGPGPRGSGP